MIPVLLVQRFYRETVNDAIWKDEFETAEAFLDKNASFNRNQTAY